LQLSNYESVGCYYIISLGVSGLIYCWIQGVPMQL